MVSKSQKNKIKEFVGKCKKSASFFISNCCKIKHPLVGIVPFKLFDYQKKSLDHFRKNRFNIFKKCRQSGLSTLTGNYALWVSMFFSNKKILIVSKRDIDAKEFLHLNVKIPYTNLPQWMKQIWKTTVWNEHEIGFTNGSIIRSLTSSPDTLRSNASSLNIIDEAAFIPDMESMWAAGYPTLQHGGAVIAISTPNGIGGWYWDKWTDAEEKTGIFNPILINWWDMNWVIEANDPISNRKVRIAPTDGLVECKTKEDIEKWGPYWSPWLEQEYKGLQAKGEAHLFRQEILGEFIGGGGTVLSGAALRTAQKQVENSPQAMTVSESVPWINQSTGEREYLEFESVDGKEGLWVWREPVKPESRSFDKSRERGHIYVMGVDVATGENNDYSAIEIFDTTTMEQVAEYMGRVSIPTLAKMVDWLGRWYNDALAIPERTGIGAALIQDLHNLLYPNLWRQKKEKTLRPGQKAPAAGVSFHQYGFATSPASKPLLNKALVQYITEEDGEGYTIYSSRLLKQLQIYIRHRNRHGIETKKTGAQEGRGNHDDLVIAAALAFYAAPDAVDIDPVSLLPYRKQESPAMSGVQQKAAQHQNSPNATDPKVLMPLTQSDLDAHAPTAQQQLDMFASQMIQRAKETPVISSKKNLIPTISH